MDPGGVGDKVGDKVSKSGPEGLSGLEEDIRCSPHSNRADAKRILAR